MPTRYNSATGTPATVPTVAPVVGGPNYRVTAASLAASPTVLELATILGLARTITADGYALLPSNVQRHFVSET